jgi:hypothetical protein
MPLFPTIPVPAPAIRPVRPSGVPAGLPSDILCDYEKGDLVLDSSGDLQLADGQRAWLQCWVNRLIVQQGAHAIYGRALGIDHARYMALPTRPRVEAEYTARLRRQVTNEPATRQLLGPRFVWQDDTLTIILELVGVSGQRAPVGVTVSA